MKSLPIADLLSATRWRFAPDQAQLEYYRRTASSYDDAHVSEEDEHAESLAHIRGFLEQIGARSVLDSGCGTGRGIRYLRQCMPHLRIEGNDPSPDLLEVARNRHGLSPDILHCSDTTSLPLGQGSFDAVMSLGVLHHVPEPGRIVRRMIELARKAVFISDSNYLGQGSLAGSIVKLALTRARLWPVVKYVQQGFHGWGYSDGDGIYYSYSVFEDLHLIESAFPRVYVIPVGRGSSFARRMPMLRAPTVLVAGIREE
jgi:SAM-dependent methyltransferase